MSERPEAPCVRCGKRISYHAGSGKWNHVSTEDAGHCDGFAIPAQHYVMPKGKIADVLADPSVEYDREDWVCVPYDDLYDLRAERDKFRESYEWYADDAAWTEES